jgi:hypothetical protein
MAKNFKAFHVIGNLDKAMELDNQVTLIGATASGRYNEIELRDQLVVTKERTCVNTDMDAFILRGVQEKNGIYQFIATFGGPLPEHMKNNSKFALIDYGVVVADVMVTYNKWTGSVSVKQEYRSPFNEPGVCPLCDHKTGEIVGSFDRREHGQRYEPFVAVTATHDSQ